MQVILNGLSNAAKLSGGPVHVRQDAPIAPSGGGDMYRCIITDAGPGLGGADARELFKEFTQVRGACRCCSSSGWASHCDPCVVCFGMCVLSPSCNHSIG